MSKPYYECHVTMEAVLAENKDRLKALVERLGWKFSAIDGDPVLGNGVKCYATKMYPARLGDQEATKAVNDAADQLAASGAKVLRRKVELVVYDDRSELACDAGCCAAHG